MSATELCTHDGIRWARATLTPPQLRWGGVRVIADGGVMSHSHAAHDPSVAERWRHLPSEAGEEETMSAPPS